MDFQKLLLDVGKALDRNEVKALTFLCTDLLSRNPNCVESAGDLFYRLADQDLLSPEKPQLLTELLLTIQRPRLVRELSLRDQASSSLVSPYRKLLYNLSEEITDGELKDVKFLLNKRLPRRKLEENVTTLEVFLEMEHMDLISATNLSKLEIVLQSVCPMLNEKILQFKALHVSPIAQEMARPRSQSCPFQPNQGSQVLQRTGSFEIPESQPLAESSLNASHTSVDFHHGGDQCEALVHELSGLKTETSSCASLTVKSDALEMLPSEENNTSSTSTNNEGLGTYPMTSGKRGICLIINNYDFTESSVSLKLRKGTEIDENCLHSVFEWLGFEVQIHQDCNKHKMLSIVSETSKRDHSQVDCLVCCVLSHGLEGSVYGVDGDTVQLRELMDPFDGLKCPTLAEKPKLFFIQACQGNKEQKAVYIEADGPAHGLVCSDARRARESIPSGADVLLAMASVPSYVSYRERTNGTWFIQSLCQNLVQMVPRRCDLVSVLTKVNADVSQKTDDAGEKKQMPQPAFSLRKRVVFPVPEAPPPSLVHS